MGFLVKLGTSRLATFHVRLDDWSSPDPALAPHLTTKYTAKKISQVKSEKPIPPVLKPIPLDDGRIFIS